MFKFKWNNDSHPGWLVRWLSPGDYHAIAIDPSDGKARFYKRENDGTLTTLATAASGLGLSNGTWYEAKVVIDLFGLASQRLRFWVDTDGDSDYSDETAQITTTAVDDVWSAGYAGLYRAAGGSSFQRYDDVKIGYDNNSDDDIADAGDDIQVDDSFGSNVLSLSYDNNGNLTDDGVYKFVYDAWNRLVEAKRRVDAETSVATYAFLGNNRRAKKVVQNCGVEDTDNDGGNTTVHFYYANPSPDRKGGVPWNVVETRNGSNQATAQYFWGTQYTDELIFLDVNGVPAVHDDCNPDLYTGEETTADEDPGDVRYFYHQDRNWNVVAISEYDTGETNNGRIVERYSYTPYGQFVALAGDSGNGEMGNLSPTSTVGNVFTFQGLAHDAESGKHHVRYRMYDGALGRFVQRDPVGYASGGMNLYAFVGNAPTIGTDPFGLACAWVDACGPGGATGGEYVGATGTECLGPNCPGDDGGCPGGDCQSQPTTQEAKTPCEKSLENAKKANKGLIDWLKSKGCYRGVKCLPPGDKRCKVIKPGDEGAFTPVTGTGGTEICANTTVTPALLTHELIHQVQSCPAYKNPLVQVGEGGIKMIALVCREVQALTCSGECHKKGKLDQECVRKDCEEIIEQKCELGVFEPDFPRPGYPCKKVAVEACNIVLNDPDYADCRKCPPVPGMVK
ncbi:MAG TPA: RHS repeat-associated core domain-containing protein [Phycisphaerae bacterium]|nr:RHS repeat-associated core domain-containing protein [Phycisphaerae bacterium]